MVPISINRTSSFPILVLLGGIFHYILKEYSVSEQWRP